MADFFVIVDNATNLAESVAHQNSGDPTDIDAFNAALNAHVGSTNPHQNQTEFPNLDDIQSLSGLFHNALI